MDGYGEETYMKYVEEPKVPRLAVVRQSVFKYVLK